MNFFQVESARPGLQPDIIFWIQNFPISNAFLLTVLIAAIFLSVGFIGSKRLLLVPGKFQMIIEMLVEACESLIQQISGSKSVTRTLLPIIGTLLLFIGLSNIIGFVPGLGAIMFDGKSLFRTPTNDFNMTITLAVAMSILTHIASIRHIGLFQHVGKFIQIKGIIDGFKAGISGGLIGIVNFFIGLMDIISEFAKLISLSMRLFGNLYAGEVMTVVLYGLVAFAIPVPWHAMSLFSGIIQALVFSMLTTVFYSLAVADSPESSNA